MQSFRYLCTWTWEKHNWRCRDQMLVWFKSKWVFLGIHRRLYALCLGCDFANALLLSRQSQGHTRATGDPQDTRWPLRGTSRHNKRMPYLNSKYLFTLLKNIKQGLTFKMKYGLVLSFKTFSSFKRSLVEAFLLINMLILFLEPWQKSFSFLKSKSTETSSITRANSVKLLWEKNPKNHFTPRFTSSGKSILLAALNSVQALSPNLTRCD